MLVKDLIEELNKLPGDTIIVMSSDGEGNSYSPLSGFSMGKYVPESTYSGNFYDILDFQSEVEEGCFEEDDAVDAFCIWPTI